MQIGEPVEIIEVQEEPSVPYEGEEIAEDQELKEVGVEEREEEEVSAVERVLVYTDRVNYEKTYVLTNT